MRKIVNLYPEARALIGWRADFSAAENSLLVCDKFLCVYCLGVGGVRLGKA